MLNKNIFTILAILTIATGTIECGRRGSSFGYGFLGGLVGSAIPNIVAGCSRPCYVQPVPAQPIPVQRVIVQQAPQTIVRETVIVPAQPQQIIRETVVVPAPQPQVRYEQTVTTNTITTNS